MAGHPAFTDERVAFVDEPLGVEARFRQHTRKQQPSPKLWADVLLLALAQMSGGGIVTFDRALAGRYPSSILLS